ncbi:glycoside hydrolase family 32 protein [Aspergillus saccharolyticus JOP 1030-1]|uniref:Wild-type from A Japonicus in complex with glucose n=1 Tax=Aspergillus saccharolyticus JOP 1030-1 TaxID=1450539 RepID=A0A318Z6Z1_9EURO|nr:wild-type from A Japonicus in complex with glucose [Aspergillus saccharolyticus JOP 1030-1]PYH42157.1 wild-type from A Japonicus in complex with glucose [Aspergillus saccharolyticus JOP 1030-1]
MKLTTTLTLATTATATATSYTLDTTLPPPTNLSALPNNTLFHLWRPRAHILPAKGQIGDPCAHYTDPTTGVFHIGYLHDGSGIAGATTSNLVTYTDVSANGSFLIQPGGKNDPVAVFDGSVIPTGVNNTPTLLYTSVSFLPIHWSIPYTRGSETQSLAVAVEGGMRFERLDQGPVIPDHPFAVDVTAFRDPFVFRSARLDVLLLSTTDTTNETAVQAAVDHWTEKGAPWYIVISGGVHGQGPVQFLYRQYHGNSSEFQYWEYLGEWWQEATNSSWGAEGGWAGGWGFNFETGNVAFLTEEGHDPQTGMVVVTLGTEGSDVPIVPQVSSRHDMLWAAGAVETRPEDGRVQFTPSMAGFVDCGFSAYAAAGKVLPATSQVSRGSGVEVDRFLSFVWLTGDQFEQAEGFPTAQQGWTGSLLLPRELTVRTVDHVVDNELVREEGVSWVVEWGESEHTTVTLRTLGIAIARETKAALLANGSVVDEAVRTMREASVVPFRQSPASKFFVLTAQLDFPAEARTSGLQSGFQILASGLEHTTIYYQFSNESLVIDRSQTSAAAPTNPGLDSFTESGRLRLFDVVDEEGGQQKIETLELTVVVDNAVLEVYANGRFALSTWARSWYANSTEIRFFHNGEGEVHFRNVSVSEGLYNAWPERK